MAGSEQTKPSGADEITMFLCGDVMTGRGIDQILPNAGAPELHEAYVSNALTYVELAERTNGPIPRPVNFEYIWGDALAGLKRVAPDVRIINLETAVTRGDDWAPKGINYRMHPANIPAITAAQIDCCALANNHVLDWGEAGLEETLDTLHAAGVRTAGAGRKLDEALAPAMLTVAGKGRVLVFAFGCESSGIPREWAAQSDRPGIALLDDLSDSTVLRIAERVRALKRPCDVVVVSIHWGGNWSYAIPAEQIRFAHGLIEQAAVDVVHGHSSHHVKGIEVHLERPILYGCGDLLSDYEGITDHTDYRDDLGLVYFVTVQAHSGCLQRFEMTPTRLRRFRINRASPAEAHWLWKLLRRESAALGVQAVLRPDGQLQLHWS
ncbi:MAG: CapA family protein [Thiogranum sp.]|nr:CapA family protein [Thiogranum sp.]